MTVWTPTDDGHADLTSHDTFISGAPQNTFKRLRDEDPMRLTEWSGGEGFWSVIRHEDILKLNGQPDLLTSARGIRMEDQSYEEYLARRAFQETDGAEHMGTRIKAAKAFSKPVIAQFEPVIRQIGAEILDDVLPRGSFDATHEIARQLPMRMLGRIIGTPEADLPWLVEKGDALIANADPDYTAHVLDKMTTDEFRMMPVNLPAGAELFVYAEDLMARKAASGDASGVLHLILQPGHDGTVMPEHESRNFFVCWSPPEMKPRAIPSCRACRPSPISPNFWGRCRRAARFGTRHRTRSSAGARPRPISAALRRGILLCTGGRSRPARR